MSELVDLSFLTERFNPTTVQKLKTEIAKSLKSSNQMRMSAQVSPDRAKWQPRKNTGSSRGRMMAKLKNQMSIRNAGDVSVGFFGETSRVAKIHHFGLSERLEFGVANYPSRELIGVSDEDKAMIVDMVKEIFHV